MTSETRVLVQESWAAVLDNAPAAAEAFYERLLDIDPHLGRMFAGIDMGEQGVALIRSLTTIVRGLRERPSLGDPYETSDDWEGAHLMVLAGALFALLERGLGERFTAPLRAAWMEVFTTCAGEIRKAALGNAIPSRVAPLKHLRVVSLGF